MNEYMGTTPKRRKPKPKKSKPYDILGGPEQRGKKYIGPGEGRPTKKATAKPKPKPRQRTSAPTLEPGLAAATKRSQGGTKKPTPRKARLNKSGYDPMLGPRPIEKAKPRRPPRQTQQPPKQKQVDDLIKWLASERTRMNKERLVKSRARAARIAAAAKKK